MSGGLLPSRAHPWLGPGCRHWEWDTERVKPTFTLPMGDALRSWSPVIARDSQTWRLGFGVGFLGFGVGFFFLFATNGKSFSPHIRREKLGAGQGKGGQKAWKGGGMAAARGSRSSPIPRSSGAAGDGLRGKHARKRRGRLTSISVGNQVENGAGVYFGMGTIFFSPPLSSAPLSEAAP